MHMELRHITMICSRREQSKTVRRACVRDEGEFYQVYGRPFAGAAGAVEFITCVKEIQDRFIHATAGYTTPDEEMDLNYVAGDGVEEDLEYALSNSLGFGGHNASILVKKWGE